MALTLDKNRDYSMVFEHADPDATDQSAPKWVLQGRYFQDNVYFDRDGKALGPPDAIKNAGKAREHIVSAQEAMQKARVLLANLKGSGTMIDMDVVKELEKVTGEIGHTPQEAVSDRLDGFREPDAEANAKAVREIGAKATKTVSATGNNFAVEDFMLELKEVSSIPAAKMLAQKHGMRLPPALKDVDKAKKQLHDLGVQRAQPRGKI